MRDYIRNFFNSTSRQHHKIGASTLSLMLDVLVSVNSIVIGFVTVQMNVVCASKVLSLKPPLVKFEAVLKALLLILFQ